MEPTLAMLYAEIESEPRCFVTKIGGLLVVFFF